MQRLVAEARDILKRDGLDIEVMDMIQFEDLQDKLEGPGVDDVARLTEELKLQKVNMNDTAVIIHSSGIRVPLSRLSPNCTHQSIWQVRHRSPRPSISLIGL